MRKYGSLSHEGELERVERKSKTQKIPLTGLCHPETSWRLKKAGTYQKTCENPQGHIKVSTSNQI